MGKSSIGDIRYELLSHPVIKTSTQWYDSKDPGVGLKLSKDEPMLRAAKKDKILETMREKVVEQLSKSKTEIEGKCYSSFMKYII